MAQNLISAQLNSEAIAEIQQHLDGIKAKMPFLLSLSAEEKVTLLVLGNVYKPLVDKAGEAVEHYPQILSGTFDINEFKQDFELLKAFETVVRQVRDLATTIEDTNIAIGSDLLSASFEVYGEVQKHKNSVPGLAALADEMKAFFPKKRQKVTPVK